MCRILLPNPNIVCFLLMVKILCPQRAEIPINILLYKLFILAKTSYNYNINAFFLALYFPLSIAKYFGTSHNHFQIIFFEVLLK